MASPLRLTVVGLDPASAEVAWRAVRDDVEASEQAMSRFRESAELVALNRRLGEEVPVGRRLYAALAACERARRRTDGRFDARVLRDLERLGEHGASVDAPAPGLVATERSVERRPRDGVVRLHDPIDLGGIGKGLALRWAAAALARLGADRFLLEAGGDIVCRGTPADGAAWRVGVEDPTGAPAPLAVVGLVDAAVVTSSIAIRHWRDDSGAEVHHLLDPSIGRPADAGLRAVSVAGADPAWAEVWSKSLFVGGRRAIAELARSRGLAAWWVADDGALAMTPAARERTLWVRDEA